MFCPNCGSKQSREKRFCTACGTNLEFVSQALTGEFRPAPAQTPELNMIEIARQRSMAKGVRFAIIGGGIVALKIFSFLFAGPFRGGSPFGFWTLIGFVLLGLGISKIISARPHHNPNIVPSSFTSNNAYQELNDAGRQPVMPQPYFSESAPDTGELAIKHEPVHSVTEDDTRTLPQKR